jgi:acyl dehydratase
VNDNAVHDDTVSAGPVRDDTVHDDTGTAWQAGRELPRLAVEPVSRTTLALFAGASGDGNPIHIDLDVARSAGLDDVFAHGMLSMAYLGRLLTDNFPQQRLRSWKVRFAAITPIHAQPVCTGRITAVDDSTGERLATLDLRVTLADGTETLAGQAVVVLD